MVVLDLPGKSSGGRRISLKHKLKGDYGRDGGTAGGVRLIAGIRQRAHDAVGHSGARDAASLIFHPFWAVEAAQQQMQQINFMKNLAIMGGTLYVMAFGAGSLSVDNRQRS